MVGPNQVARSSRSAVGQIGHGRDAVLLQPGRGALADAPQIRDRALTHQGDPVRRREPEHPLGRRLGEAGRHLGAFLGLADPDRTGERGRSRTRARSSLGQTLGVGDRRRRARPRPSPRPRPDGRTSAAPPSPRRWRRRRRDDPTAGTPPGGTSGTPAPAASRSAPRRPAPRTTRWPPPVGPVGSPSPPTTTGRPRSSGRRRTSTAARNASTSTCRIHGSGSFGTPFRLPHPHELVASPRSVTSRLPRRRWRRGRRSPSRSRNAPSRRPQGTAVPWRSRSVDQPTAGPQAAAAIAGSSTVSTDSTPAGFLRDRK